MAGESGERLFLVLKRVEMKQERADQHVPFGMLQGIGLSLYVKP